MRGGAVARVAVTESIGTPIDSLLDLLSHRPPAWLEPFLRLCAHEADSIAHRLAKLVGREAPEPHGLRVRVELGGAAPYGRGKFGVPVRWNSADRTSVLGVFVGRFVLEPSGTSTELCVEGLYEPPPDRSRDAVDTGIAVEAVRSGLRALLGNLKSAVEEQARG